RPRLLPPERSRRRDSSDFCRCRRHRHHLHPSPTRRSSDLHNGDTTVTVTIQATKAITGRRRTLYTVTVPDSKGTWYWHSHLWTRSEERRVGKECRVQRSPEY